ncbi:MAG: hypothetical protein O3A93_07585 [Chloroflexi bacterium]|nr:hypothetical protein [Chloroflexota bacterium]MDA1271106.1 hypothetical protein [Chloroflexota bacterium]
MATLGIGKAHINLGGRNDRHSQAGTQENEGIISGFSRFLVSAQGLADKYADYKYNQTEWMMFRL